MPDDDAPVTLVSAEGFEFVVDADAARVSTTVKHMLASEGVWGCGGVWTLWYELASMCRCEREGRGGGRAGQRGCLPHRRVGAKPRRLPARTARHPRPGFCIQTNMLPHPPIHRFPGGFTEAEARRVTFPEIPGVVLERVCQYFYYKLQYNDA